MVSIKSGDVGLTNVMRMNLPVRVLLSRWFMVFATMLILSAAGATYMFGLYSGDIKSSLGYDQTTLNLLSFFKDLGSNVGILSGLINEISPPWVVLSIGAVLNFFGYFMIWMAVTKKMSTPKVWLMCLYICIGANSQSFANTGALVTCVKNFPESRGAVLGLLKGFVGLSGAILTQIYHAIYGATYLFGVYSKTIKSTLGYDQSTLNLLGTFKDLGANVGVLSGLLAEVTPTWFVLLVGSVMNFTGYFLIWLAVTKKIATPKVWHMCMYICIGANSQNFANTGSLVTCVKNFPESRGMMLGLMKGFVGLSGAIFTQLYLAIYGNDAKSLILLIGWLPALLSLLFTFSIREKKFSRHPNEVKVFYVNLVISIVLALLLMGTTIAQKYIDFSHVGYVACATIVCVVLFLPLLVAIREEYSSWKLKKEELKSYNPTRVMVEEPPLPESKAPVSEIVKSPEYSSMGKKEVGCFSDIFKKPKRGEDYTILQALLSIDMLILFVTTFCGLGCSLASIDNLGQIGESLGYPQHTISTFVSLMSIWNYFGRVYSGFISEKLLLKWKVPRTLMMTFALLLPAIGDLIIAFPFPGSVYVASLLIGFSFGIQLTLLFIIISELFGLKYYSTLFNCGQLASPLGSYILNVQIVGRLYDNEALKQLASKGLTRSMVNELTCIGKQCYRNSFIILACVNLFGALVSFILVMRTKDYYKSDIYKRFRDQLEANEKEMKMISAAGK